MFFIVLFLLLLLLVLTALALSLGLPTLSLLQVWTILTSSGGSHIARIVVLQLRLPRLLLAALAGAAFALSGVLLQNSLRNPLAGPELLGVSAGASVVVATVVIFNLTFLLPFRPLLALAGGILGGSVVVVATRRTSDLVRLVLIGAAVTALLNALLISIISIGNSFDVNALLQYLFGSLAGLSWDSLQVVLPWAVICIPLALLCGRPLNLLQLGDEVAEGLGLRVLPIRFGLALLSTGLVAAVIAVCGPIGYIALLSPHVARRFLDSTDARQILPIAALFGATLLVGADLLARQILFPLEIPVGIMTSILGGPILLFILQRRLRRISQ